MVEQLIMADDHELTIRALLSQVQKSGLRSTGVIHVGAHLGEEVPVYREFGYSPIILVEPNPSLLSELTLRCQGQDTEIVGAAVADRAGLATLYEHRTVGGSVESASLLKLGELGDVVTFQSNVVHSVMQTTVDELLGGRPESWLLVVDAQGSEVKVLHGAKKSLGLMNAVICEVNVTRNYVDAPLEHEIDEFLESFGFSKVFAIYHELYRGSFRWPAWGECLYAKVS